MSENRCSCRPNRTRLLVLVALGTLSIVLLLTLRNRQATTANETLTLLDATARVALRGEVAIVVMTSRRPEVQQLLNQLMTADRPANFRIFVSQDGGDPVTSHAVSLFHPALTRLRFSGGMFGDSYIRIARHLRHLLDFLFMRLQYQHVVVMEDDLLIAPDFYAYFDVLRTVLDSDKSVFCVSAWNDNGLSALVKNDATLLHRTDFFPGLGWMINRATWQKLRDHWPGERFDDFLRKYMLKESLVCLRPEVSRTFKIGLCGGRKPGEEDPYKTLFYHMYLSRMVLNQQKVRIPSSAIKRLSMGRVSDFEFQKKVMDTPEAQLSSILTSDLAVARIRYQNEKDFVQIALQIGIIPEVWFGIPRCSLMGIVTVRIRGCQVYIAPDARLNITDTVVIPTREQFRLATLGVN